MPPLPSLPLNLRPQKLLQTLLISILYLLTIILTLFSVLVIASTWTFFMLDYSFENLSVTVLSGIAEVVLVSFFLIFFFFFFLITFFLPSFLLSCSMSTADRLCDFVGLEMTDEGFYYFGREEEEEEW
ncbi:uncharacterized protein EAF02_005408 [Botrytis sinoallii]|uniref:uncharacterized protein n=1 Tax=Botrytis sinoallii TaxID=1463999 RepID=UPI0018FF2045|nr:uncharacterized protein EAF02_005408 [Botrytis sinoallii]KAF7883488.1 hypothetical protein EAF02_005408 [Botrytis sinoallii]